MLASELIIIEDACGRVVGQRGQKFEAGEILLVQTALKPDLQRLFVSLIRLHFTRNSKTFFKTLLPNQCLHRVYPHSPPA